MISDFAGVVKAEVEFTALDGNTYKLSPLTLREIGNFCIWVQFREYEIAKQIVSDKDHLKEIYEKCRLNPISFDSMGFLEAFGTPEGAVKLFYLSLKIAHPSIKEFDLSKLIALEEIVKITDKVYDISGLVSSEDKTENLGELNQGQ